MRASERGDALLCALNRCGVAGQSLPEIRRRLVEADNGSKAASTSEEGRLASSLRPSSRAAAPRPQSIAGLRGSFASKQNKLLHPQPCGACRPAYTVAFVLDWLTPTLLAGGVLFCHLVLVLICELDSFFKHFDNGLGNAPELLL